MHWILGITLKLIHRTLLETSTAKPLPLAQSCQISPIAASCDLMASCRIPYL
jgi:hypothetical protein